jgi:hypothetical protein
LQVKMSKEAILACYAEHLKPKQKELMEGV